MNAVVLYRSRYGFTERYAGWIAQELGADCLPVQSCKASQLSGYDTVIYGGGLYAGGINGARFLVKRRGALRGKRVVVFTVGFAPVDQPAAFAGVIERNFPQDMRGEIKFFHLRGGMDYPHLSFAHRMMMGMLRRMLSKKENPTDDDKALLATYGETLDYTDRASIAPLIEYVKGGRS